MARDSKSPSQEAADTFAVRTCLAIARFSALPCHGDSSGSRQTASGGALRAALTRTPRRGQSHLRDEGQAFVAIDETTPRDRLRLFALDGGVQTRLLGSAHTPQDAILLLRTLCRDFSWWTTPRLLKTEFHREPLVA